MNVAEAIKILSEMPLDMDIVVQDGLDPSDWDVAKSIEIDGFYPYGDRGDSRKCVYIK